MLPIAATFPEYLGAWGTLAAAAGTVAAVLIALYRDTWRARRRRPMLTLSVADDAVLGGVRIPEPMRGVLPGIRLKIANAPGRNTATDVEVLMSAWQRVVPSNGRDEPWQPFFELRPLVWSSKYESREPDATLTEIPAGVSRHVEFARVGRPSDLQAVIEGRALGIDVPPELTQRRHIGEAPPPPPEEGSSWLESPDCGVLVVPPFDGSYRHVLPEHMIYRFRFVVAARDIDAVTYDAVLRLSAWWFGPREKYGVQFNTALVGPERLSRSDAPFKLPDPPEPPPKPPFVL